MRVLGFPEEAVDSLLRLVAGLLHLGQVRIRHTRYTLASAYFLYGKVETRPNPAMYSPTPPNHPPYQLAFTADDSGEGSQLAPAPHVASALKAAAELLQLSPSYLKEVLTTRVMETPGESFTVKLRPNQVRFLWEGWGGC